VSISPVAGLVGGVAGGMIGAGTAFWIGAVLGAAGMDRLDAKLLGQVGVDMDALVAKAVEAAGRARAGGAAAAEPDAADAEATETDQA
jgi:ribosomal protein L12E/L44/L45/RPP1/RPP2